MDEAVAECYAAQRVETTALLLSADAAYARRMAYVDWVDVYPSMPAAYRTADCRPGGPLDISGRWP